VAPPALAWPLPVAVPQASTRRAIRPRARCSRFRERGTEQLDGLREEPVAHPTVRAALAQRGRLQ
jgi:hypothetical protein